VTFSINWEATDAISWNSCYVCVCSCALNIFKIIEATADCEIRSVIRFLNGRSILSSEIHQQICQVYGDNAISDDMVRKWVRMFNEGQENVHDEVRSGVHLWWMMIWCIKSRKECVTTDVSQFLICPCTFLRFQGLYDIVSSHLGRTRPHSMRRVYKNLCPATISASIMAANMWKHSLKNVESDNNKFYTKPYSIFLQRNGTYFLNKPRSLKSLIITYT